MNEQPRWLEALRCCRRAVGGRYRGLRLEVALGIIALRERQLLLHARRSFECQREQPQRPLVSVTIPTYNRGRLLAVRTLPSVLNQTHENLEIVIVGDCCEDDTEERIARLADPRIRFCNLPERGRYPEHPLHRWMVAGSVPVNRALQLARGEWLAYLDDDDVFTPDHIETLLAFAVRGDYELVFGRHKYEKAPGVWAEHGGPRMPTGHLRARRDDTVVPHSSVMYRSYLRSFEYLLHSWRYGLPADYLLWRRMGRAGVRAGFLDQVVSLGPLRPGEMMLTPAAIRLAMDAELRHASRS